MTDVKREPYFEIRLTKDQVAVVMSTLELTINDLPEGTNQEACKDALQAVRNFKIVNPMAH